MSNKPEMTYAELWAGEINETYPAHPDLVETLMTDAAEEGEDRRSALRRILGKAAECLRNGVPATFTAAELDLVRYLMPAHEVHQSGAKRWVLDVYGRDGEQGNTDIEAETAAYVAAQEQAIEWSRIVQAAMTKRGAETIRELYEMLSVAEDLDAAAELDAVKSLGEFLAAEQAQS